MLVAAILVGATYNLQYSSQQVFSLISFHLPLFGMNAAFFLLIVVPVLGFFFGNIYCGYLCPFGAMQELIGEFRPHRLDTDPNKKIWRYGRSVKYLLLAFLASLLAFTRDFSVLKADPLITLFGTGRSAIILGLAGAALFVSFFYRRFWCRNLCPPGAFLSLISSFRPLNQYLPPPRPGKCDLGIQTTNEKDCLTCDRCRLD